MPEHTRSHRKQQHVRVAEGRKPGKTAAVSACKAENRTNRAIRFSAMAAFSGLARLPLAGAVGKFAFFGHCRISSYHAGKAGARNLRHAGHRVADDGEIHPPEPRTAGAHMDG